VTNVFGEPSLVADEMAEERKSDLDGKMKASVFRPLMLDGVAARRQEPWQRYRSDTASRDRIVQAASSDIQIDAERQKPEPLGNAAPFSLRR
jgi:hypothetical protein